MLAQLSEGVFNIQKKKRRDQKTKEKETKAVTPWRPFMDLTRWERDMERMMDDFFGRRMRPWWPERWSRAEALEITPQP
jgi:hypothetical protein